MPEYDEVAAFGPDEPDSPPARLDGFVLVERAAGILMHHHG